MRLITLYSGSGGNSTYIEAGDASILIDAGKSARRLCTALNEIGSSPDKLDAILITHEHGDHVSALETLSKKYKIPIHIIEESSKNFSGDRFATLRERMVIHPPIYELCINGTHIRSFPTSHDSRMSAGYRIDFSENGCLHSIGFATDVGYVSDAVKCGLCGCEAVVLESNHDKDMLISGSYPYDLKQRILSRRGHLSNAESALFAAELASKGTRAFILAHLSEENNTPSLALSEFLASVADPDISVAIADAEQPTEICF